MLVRHNEALEALVGNWPPIDPAMLVKAPGMPIDSFARKAAMPPHSIDRVFRSETGDFIAIGCLPEGATDPTDTLFLAEFVRQGVETIARTLLGMAPEDVFVLKTVDVKRAEDLAKAQIAGGAQAVIMLPKDGVRYRADGSAYAVDGPVYCYLSDQSAALLGGTVAFLKPEDYATLRGAPFSAGFGYPTGHVEPLFPSCVGRVRQTDVLIGRVHRHVGGVSATMVPQYPQAYFDRPLDHYPGMMMAEAARQLAVYATYLVRDVVPLQIQVGSIRMSFDSFAELDTPPVLHAAVKRVRPGGQTISVRVRQNRIERARFEIATNFNTRRGGAS